MLLLNTGVIWGCFLGEEENLNTISKPIPWKKNSSLQTALGIVGPGGHMLTQLQNRRDSQPGPACCPRSARPTAAVTALPVPLLHRQGGKTRDGRNTGPRTRRGLGSCPSSATGSCVTLSKPLLLSRSRFSPLSKEAVGILASKGTSIFISPWFYAVLAVFLSIWSKTVFHSADCI